MKIFQISSEVNSGSVGRIAEQIGEEVLEQGWESYITFARANRPSQSNTIRIGTFIDVYWHALMNRVFDNDGFMARRTTSALIEKIKMINPDVIHLHHLHGYFINIEILFEFLSQSNIPLVWSFHDCWSFTGHCAHYEYVNCQKWQTQCYSCPQKGQYPKSLILDGSRRNYNDKKRIFTSVKNMVIVPVSNWLGKEVQKSFLRNYSVKVIQNGIDLDVFKPHCSRSSVFDKYGIEKEKFLVLGVASTWSHRKGLDIFINFVKIIAADCQIVMVGLTKSQIKEAPQEIIGIERTEDVQELSDLYSAADVFVNPTLEEALGLTNIEAIACGTPVITFNSGGASETIDDTTGIIVRDKNATAISKAVQEVREKGKLFYSKSCRERAEIYFNKKDRYREYIELYKNLLHIN